MKCIDVKEAVGHVLCHDITMIVKDQIKDAVFRKGHIIQEEDIPILQRIGKNHIYVWEKDETMLHEDEAAEILAGICKNEGMRTTSPKEGKIELIAETEGLFLVDVERLEQINSIEEMMIACRHTYYAVHAGDKLAGTRVIPLVISKEKMEAAKRLAGNEPLMEIRPYRRKKAGVITTGSEVYHHLIEDTFTPVIVEKLFNYGIQVVAHETVPDDKEEIQKAILRLKQSGVEMILCTGGMSVDPDDLTPSAITSTGAEIISYGAPVLPGAMFLMGYFQDGTPIMGLPGCVMYAKSTIFDLVLPRVAADIKITKKDLAKLGHGGLCLGCPICHYPNCGFGKGM